ncbi:MAG: 4Fe-4S binding protein [Oscillospiraceae bacterium]|nr:4Fe-4S binding protein [Oscillospiraceae bacterium]
MDNKLRGRVQFVAALVQNADLRGFFTGRIDQGAQKAVCVPGLNCYSCPGALMSCPIGSLQAFLSARPVKVPYYVAGLLLFFGALLGRAVCGFLCPFGWIQELLHKIPFPRKKLGTFPGDRLLRRLKYLVLAGLVVLVPMLLTDWTPAFCKYLCPAGTLEGGVPLVLLHGERLHLEVGPLFFWKLFILVAVVLSGMAIYRPFCKYLCPLGALYAPFNRVALYRMRLSEDRCVACGKCARVCPMQVDPSKTPNSGECIRCGVCVGACPTKALRLGVREKQGQGIRDKGQGIRDKGQGIRD